MGQCACRVDGLRQLPAANSKKTLTTKDTESTKKNMDGTGLGSILSCGEGTVYCSLATGEV